MDSRSDDGKNMLNSEHWNVFYEKKMHVFDFMIPFDYFWVIKNCAHQLYFTEYKFYEKNINNNLQEYRFQFPKFWFELVFN